MCFLKKTKKKFFVIFHAFFFKERELFFSPERERRPKETTTTTTTKSFGVVDTNVFAKVRLRFLRFKRRRRESKKRINFASEEEEAARRPKIICVLRRRRAHLKGRRRENIKMLLCAISGEQPARPVVTPSGHVFEQSLIEKMIKETGENPITKQTLTLDELIPINRDVSSKAIKPRATAHASIPGLLQTFHDEYDGLMLELFETRKRLNESERELAAMAYQMDAANRTVARLVKERDEARAMVGSVAATTNGTTTTTTTTTNNKKREGGGDADAFAKKAKNAIPQTILDVIDSTNKELMAERKKKKTRESLKTKEEIGKFTLQDPVPGHKTNTAIHSVDVLHEKGLIVTAGADGTASLFDEGLQKSSSIATGHKKCLDAKFLLGADNGGDVIATCGSDNTVKVWKSGKNVATYDEHTQDVVSVASHVAGAFFVSASADASWHFHDVESASTLYQATNDDPKDKYTAIDIHPDGMFLAALTQSGAVQLWDAKSCVLQQTLSNGGKNSAKSCSFSENGYFFAVSGDEGCKIWDLRKNTVAHDFGNEKCPCLCRLDKSGNTWRIAPGKPLKCTTSKASGISFKLSITRVRKEITACSF